ncbi:hypothetical protein [Lysobacter gummosus]|uniref:hypothetical protein n=1 Tax=Lysobacter gummosus TaxID=262324 RepID=UPI003636481B
MSRQGQPSPFTAEIVQPEFLMATKTSRMQVAQLRVTSPPPLYQTDLPIAHSGGGPHPPLPGRAAVDDAQLQRARRTASRPPMIGPARSEFQSGPRSPC